MFYEQYTSCLHLLTLIFVCLSVNSRDGNLFMVMSSASLNSQPSSVQPSGQESNLPSQPCFCLDWPWRGSSQLHVVDPSLLEWSFSTVWPPPLVPTSQLGFTSKWTARIGSAVFSSQLVSFPSPLPSSLCGWTLLPCSTGPRVPYPSRLSSPSLQSSRWWQCHWLCWEEPLPRIMPTMTSMLPPEQPRWHVKSLPNFLGTVPAGGVSFLRKR